VVEPQNPPQQELDTSRLLASGVSVTIVEKSKQKSPEEPAKDVAPATPAAKVTSEIGLGSDVSVTLVQKKKTSDATENAANSATRAPPKISVKKESELLQDPTTAKDIVQVKNGVKTFLSFVTVAPDK